MCMGAKVVSACSKSIIVNGDASLSNSAASLLSITKNLSSAIIGYIAVTYLKAHYSIFIFSLFLLAYISFYILNKISDQK